MLTCASIRQTMEKEQLQLFETEPEKPRCSRQVQQRVILRQGDCLELMPELPDKSVDLAIIDWPYNIKKADWDSIPNYLEWCGRVLKEHERILKENGSMYIFHNKFSFIVDIFRWIAENTGFVFKQFIYWDKLTDANKGFAHQRLSIDSMRNYYNGFAEYVLYYTFQDETGLDAITEQYIKPKNPFAAYLRDEFKRADVNNKDIAALFPSKTGGLTGCVSNWLNGDNVITRDQYIKIRNHLNNGTVKYLRREYEYLRREYEDLRREYEENRYSFNVQNVSFDFRCNSTCWKYWPNGNNGHETPKPEPLIKNIIRHSSNEGDTVIDAFMGSGTTGAVCVKENRAFIGIEKNADKFKSASKRIHSAI